MPDIAPPNTKAQLSHSLTIRMQGETIGAINEWNPTMTRNITEMYEFGPVDMTYSQRSGEPFELAPGNITGTNIAMRRYDLYQKQLESAFSTPDLTMLSNQVDPMSLREVWFYPVGQLGSYFNLYEGCWWGEMGRSLDSKGDRQVNAGGSIRFTYRRRQAYAA